MPIPASDIKWSSNVSWAACTACDAMMSPMPTTISAGGTGRVREPSPERTDAATIGTGATRRASSSGPVSGRMEPPGMKALAAGDTEDARPTRSVPLSILWFCA